MALAAAWVLAAAACGRRPEPRRPVVRVVTSVPGDARDARAPSSGAARPTLAASGPAAVGVSEGARIELFAGLDAIPVGGTGYVHAQVVDSIGRTALDPVIRWSSSDTTVAAVAPVGYSHVPVRGLSAGRASVTAASGGLSASVTVFVGELPPAVALLLVPARVQAVVGQAVPLRALALSAARDTLRGCPVTWAASDSAAARSWDLSSARGESIIYRARTPGVVTIVATCQGVRGSAVVEVRE